MWSAKLAPPPCRVVVVHITGGTRLTGSADLHSRVASGNGSPDVIPGSGQAGSVVAHCPAVRQHVSSFMAAGQDTHAVGHPRCSRGFLILQLQAAAACNGSSGLQIAAATAPFRPMESCVAALQAGQPITAPTLITHRVGGCRPVLPTGWLHHSSPVHASGRVEHACACARISEQAVSAFRVRRSLDPRTTPHTAGQLRHHTTVKPPRGAMDYLSITAVPAHGERSTALRRVRPSHQTTGVGWAAASWSCKARAMQLPLTLARPSKKNNDSFIPTIAQWTPEAGESPTRA